MQSIRMMLLSGCAVLLLSGCGDKEPEQSARAERNHVWKSQTQALETARSVAKDVEVQRSDMDDRIRRATRE